MLKHISIETIFTVAKRKITVNLLSLLTFSAITLIGFYKPTQGAHLVALTALCVSLINLDFLLISPIACAAKRYLKTLSFFDTLLDIEIVMLIDFLICIIVFLFVMTIIFNENYSKIPAF